MPSLLFAGLWLFPKGKSAWAWSRPFTFIQRLDEEWVKLYLHSRICCHGVHEDLAVPDEESSASTKFKKKFRRQTVNEYWIGNHVGVDTYGVSEVISHHLSGRTKQKTQDQGQETRAACRYLKLRPSKHKAKCCPLRRDVCWCWFEVSSTMTIDTWNFYVSATQTKFRELLLCASRGIWPPTPQFIS